VASRIDLHVHSNASDGKYSPEEIITRAAGLGLEIIALADHDTVSGIPPALAAARAFPQLRVIPAVEISTDVPSGEVHVLGYFIDFSDNGLKSVFERMQRARKERAQQIIARLDKLGMPVEWWRVQEIAGSGTVGRPHIAQAMLDNGYISSLKEAFNRYIGHGGPAYVEWQKITPDKAVALVLATDGLPVLAHPLTATEPETLVRELTTVGLVGLEAYYDDYAQEDRARLIALARRYDLTTTGGSDYHGLDEENETMIGAAGVPPRAAAELIALAERRSVSDGHLEKESEP
jgi:predicted metal-dependent phosphoesterase TrpH